LLDSSRSAFSRGTLACSKGARLCANCLCALAQGPRALSCCPRALSCRPCACLKPFLALLDGALCTVDVSLNRRDDVMELVLAAVNLAGDRGRDSSTEHEDEDCCYRQQLHG
jgi:hypothetical protein